MLKVKEREVKNITGRVKGMEERMEREKKEWNERRKEPFGTVYHVITIIIVSQGKVVS